MSDETNEEFAERIEKIFDDVVAKTKEFHERYTQIINIKDSHIDRLQSENKKLRDDLADLQCWYDALRAEAISLAKGSDD